MTRAGTGVKRDGKKVVATEEEVRAGADDHCTEDDDKVIVRADESEAQDDRRIYTDAEAGKFRFRVNRQSN